MLPALSIELAHIYADQDFSDEQRMSIDHAQKVIDQFKSQGAVVTTVLIDDLHVEQTSLDVDGYVKTLEEKGIIVDQVVFEGKLSPISDHIIRILPHDRLKWESFKRGQRRVLNFHSDSGEVIGLKIIRDDREEHTCAILSAAWSLCRLGIYPFPPESIMNLTGKSTYGVNVVSVLHGKFEGVERKVLTLIKACGFDLVVPRLNHIFFGD